MHNKVYVTRRQLRARYGNCSPMKIARMVQRGLLPPPIDGGRLFDMELVEQKEAERQAEAEQRIAGRASRPENDPALARNRERAAHARQTYRQSRTASAEQHQE